MSRYQVYLSPQSVAVIDQAAVGLDLTRSHIIRDVVDRVAYEYARISALRKSFDFKSHPILKMSGIIDTASKNLSENVDSIYLHD